MPLSCTFSPGACPAISILALVEMTATGREYLGEAWWIAIFPALALTLVIVAFNIVGDWLRDWLDPRAEQG